MKITNDFIECEVCPAGNMIVENGHCAMGCWYVGGKYIPTDCPRDKEFEDEHHKG